MAIMRPMRRPARDRPACALPHPKTSRMVALLHSRFRAAAAVVAAAAALLVATPALADVAGATLFKATCAVCHSIVPKQIVIGPPLFGVVGRKAGSFPGFQYSAAMKKAGWIWSPDKLATYIDDPRKTVPGNRMPFFGVHDVAKAQTIAAYLATLK